MKTVTPVAFALAMGLMSTPAFAADEALVQFAALTSIESDGQSMPTPLSDEQLAAVEGGTHLSLAIRLLQLAQQFQSSSFGTVPQNLTFAALLQSAAANILQNNRQHACTAPATC